jgi:hypothetical protein
MPENIIADHSTASSTACRVADPFRRILVGSNLVGSNGMASNIRLRLFILSVPHRVALIQINGCFETPWHFGLCVHRTNNRRVTSL